MRQGGACVVALLLGGCAGRGIGSLPAANATAASAPLALRLVIPAPNPSSGARPMYVSRNTQGLGISYGAHPATFPAITTPAIADDVSSGSSLCTTNSDGSRTCNIAIPAPVGSDDFQVTAWDAVPASGSFSGANRLSGTTVTKTVTAGQANTLSFTLDGVVNSIGLFVTPSSLVAAPSGTSSTATLSVNATDIDNNIIMGSGNYTDANGNPLTISIGQSIVAPGGPVRTTLSSNVVTSAAANTVTVTYPGGSTYGTTFTATPSIPIAGTSTTATLTVNPSVTEFSSPFMSGPQGITTGPDGNLWFVNYNGNSVGKITPAGSATSVASTGDNPSDVTVGSDGNLWFTETVAGAIGRCTPSGTCTQFTSGITSGQPVGIAAGPDGNLWFAQNSGDLIDRITPSGVVTEFSSGISSNAGPQYITAGPDGNLWFTEVASRIGRITTSGVVTEFSTGITSGAQPFGIASGPDGNLWFTECNEDIIGRITTSGVVTEFSVGLTPSCNPFGITAGPDGNLWFAENNGDRVGRITPSGAITEFSTGISASAGPWGITTGPDGNLWFTEESGNRIGRLIY
jgi:streptogramin lyase